MLNWNDICNIVKLLKTPRQINNEEQKEDFDVGDYINWHQLSQKLTEQQKEEYARETFQKNPPLKARQNVTQKIKTAQDSIAMDSNNYADCIKNMITGNVPDIIYSYFARQGFIGWEACATLKQNWIINNACNIPGQDAIRPGYKLSLAHASEDKQTEEINSFKSQSVKKYKILDICALAVEKKKVFGSCLIAPCFSQEVDLSVPFNPEAIKPNSYKGMVVIEPRWLQFDFDEESLTDPTSQHYYEPTWFSINGRKIHRSWCVHLKNTVVPDVLKPTYYYGGIPLTQMLFQRVYAAEKIANEAPMLAMSKRLLVVDVPLISKIMKDQQVENDIQRIVHYRDNWGVISKRPGDSVQQIDTSLADFESVLMSQYQLVAAIAQMPATKLLKAQPTGMNATGEYDFKDYVQSLETIQNNDMKPIIDNHNKFYSLSLQKDYDFIVAFNPIDVPTKLEMSQVNSSKAQLLSTLVSTGVISQDEARDVLRADEDTDFSNLADSPQNESPDEENEVQKLLNSMKENYGTKTESNNNIETSNT